MRTILGYTMRSFIAFLSLLTAILISTNMITRQQKDDGLILNISGIQRMLTQKMVKEALICFNLAARNRQNDLKDWKEQLLLTMKLFESILYALKDGGKVPLNYEMTQFRQCPPAPTKEIDIQLEKVFLVWVSIKNNIDKSIYSEFTDIDAMNYVINNNIELLEEMDRGVLLMQYNAERNVKLMAQIQSVAIGAGVVIVIFSMFMIKTNIVDPINYFIKTAESMSMGKLNSELKTSGLKEIAALSQSMNRLRISTIKMMEMLNR
ncbi:MAG: type IV pili methyl-accepting chemotaxis transducer N-terminal domain-containing protein [Desulfamplus sp.]|nr:type IV pili methyl-accepting chemotaxis transducer N-terminal domain-containing protein [Desulfamplus sp.]